MRGKRFSDWFGDKSFTKRLIKGGSTLVQLSYYAIRDLQKSKSNGLLKNTEGSFAAEQNTETQKTNLEESVAKTTPRKVVEAKTKKSGIKVSVIVPMYNVAEYLRECLESLANQTLKDIEVIIIDDGSEDFGPDVADWYADKYSHFRVIHKENQGQSVARNIGIKSAKGEYIAFVDSDDRAPTDSLEILYSTAKKNDSDMVIGSAESFNSKQRYISHVLRKFHTMYYANTNLDHNPELVLNGPPWNKLYRRSILIDNGILFREDIDLAEDLDLVVRCMNESKRIAVIPKVVYHYRIRELGSQVSHTQSVKCKGFQDSVDIAYGLRDYLKTKDREELADKIDFYLLRGMTFRLDKMIKEIDPEHCEDEKISAVFDIFREFINHINSECLQIFHPSNQLKFSLIQMKEYGLAERLSAEGITAELVQDLIDLGYSKNSVIWLLVSLYQQKSNDLNRRYQHLLSKSRSEKSNGHKGFFNQSRNKAKQLRIQLQDSIANKLRQGARSYLNLLANQLGDQDIWLIGEHLGNTAEDTGYHFFKYCRETYPDQPIYYVIKRQSTHRTRVELLGNVLYYDEPETFWYLIRAKALVYSNCMRDLTSKWSRQEYFVGNRAVRCFLQHGVVGLHRMGDYYSKSSIVKRNEDADIVITSSEFEKEIFEKTLGYPSDTVYVTGLSRYDNLQPGSKGDREILYCPTWRSWLAWSNESKLLKSDFFKTISAFLNAEELHKVLEMHDCRLRFMLHRMMAKYLAYFKCNDERIIIDDGRGIMQEKIKSTGMLITDYSSVAFDVIYQKRPVVFFQFDREDFFKARGKTPIDYDTELFGDVIFDIEALIKTIDNLAKNLFVASESHLKRAERYFKYRNSGNSKRIYNAIKEKINQR